ncbi:hypothetical protein ABZS66_19005 [Dactylosporangium sp. NPDC005572]|uniref:hypothetical protein n=1 Tax=Dactylosporangium sp. NPDC005572 TaxID=3156889 RepID=UPI0033ACB144
MAADTVILLAAAVRQLGRREATYSVMHLPRDDVPSTSWCSWPGPLVAMTVARAVAQNAVACNRCPLIKAHNQGIRP